LAGAGALSFGTAFWRNALASGPMAKSATGPYGPLLDPDANGIMLPQGFTSICGPTSVANVLRSMGVRAGRNPLKGFGVRAMSLDQVAAESSQVVPSPWRVTAVRPATVEALREELRGSNDLSRRFVSNFARSSLFGGGSGHHSPIGGYLAEEDLVFVLDVNAGYGPWLVGTDRLFDAMNTVADWSTGRTRGLARFER
jgi:hypothetical protein